MGYEYALRFELNEYPVPNPDTAWGKRRLDLRDKMRSDDWSDFLRWPVVRASLFTGQIPNTDAELEDLLSPGRDYRWYAALESLDFIPWNGTAIHQAHLMSWYGDFQPDFMVAEFGAGYGEMYRLLQEYGHTGEYFVYDFPELLILQEYYLRSHDVDISRWHPCYTMEQWNRLGSPDLFVSVCAMSEAPLEDREGIWNIEPYSCAIRYQPTWDGINNTEYFFRIAEDMDMEAHRETAPNYLNHSLMKME